MSQRRRVLKPGTQNTPKLSGTRQIKYSSGPAVQLPPVFAVHMVMLLQSMVKRPDEFLSDGFAERGEGLGPLDPRTPPPDP